MTNARFHGRTGTRIRRPLPPAARERAWVLPLLALILVAVSLLAAGCGGSGGSEADAGSASAAGGSSSGSDVNDQLAEYSQCMRENGVPSFPDLRAVNGQIQLSLPAGVDPDSPQFQQATEACRSLSPVQQNGGGAPSAEQQEQVLKFVKCMRKNGVPDFPDPSKSGGTIVTGIDPNSPQFESALQACQSLIPAGTATTG
jgi:hypothetical protein